MIKVVIVEDEINSQELLQSILEQHYNYIEVVGVAESVKKGIAVIKEVKPDVVFLDIEIQGGTGFDILNAIPEPSFRVIFVTGYDHYALKAIKYSALDYILKPINLEELDTAISKINIASIDQKDRLKFLQEQVLKPVDKIDQFVLSDENGHRVIRFNEVLFVKSDGSYVTFYLQDGNKNISTNPLSFYESILPSALFFRVHKSYLVNLTKIINIDSGRGGLLKVEEDNEVPVAYRRKAALVKRIKQV